METNIQKRKTPKTSKICLYLFCFTQEKFQSQNTETVLIDLFLRFSIKSDSCQSLPPATIRFGRCGQQMNCGSCQFWQWTTVKACLRNVQIWESCSSRATSELWQLSLLTVDSCISDCWQLVIKFAPVLKSNSFIYTSFSNTKTQNERIADS